MAPPPLPTRRRTLIPPRIQQLPEFTVSDEEEEEQEVDFEEDEFNLEASPVRAPMSIVTPLVTPFVMTPTLLRAQEIADSRYRALATAQERANQLFAAMARTAVPVTPVDEPPPSPPAEDNVVGTEPPPFTNVRDGLNRRRALDEGLDNEEDDDIEIQIARLRQTLYNLNAVTVDDELSDDGQETNDVTEVEDVTDERDIDVVLPKVDKPPLISARRHAFEEESTESAQEWEQIEYGETSSVDEVALDFVNQIPPRPAKVDIEQEYEHFTSPNETLTRFNRNTFPPSSDVWKDTNGVGYYPTGLPGYYHFKLRNSKDDTPDGEVRLFYRGSQLNGYATEALLRVGDLAEEQDPIDTIRPRKSVVCGICKIEF